MVDSVSDLQAPVLVEIAGGIATLTLNRASRLNALTQAMYDTLNETFDDIAADPAIRAVILTGSGRGFCAGQDLSERADGLAVGEVDLAAMVDGNTNRLIRKMLSLPVPIIAAINGVAAGAGVGIALAADIVLAARSASFVLSFAKIGLGPDAGVSWMLPRLVGIPRAMGMMLTATPVSAEDAAGWGMIWRCIEDDRLIAEARALSESFAAGARHAYAATRRTVHAGSAGTLDEALDRERDQQGWLGRTPDYREAVLAFTEKRAAKFADASYVVQRT